MKKRTELQSRNQALTGLFAIGITALFLAGFLTLVVFGAKTYRATVAEQRSNNELRSQLSYISTMCKSMDASGAVTVYDTDLGQVLSVEDGSGYALRLYVRDGHLVEDYSPAGSDLRPEDSEVIGTTDTFSVTRNGGLLLIRTDAGQLILHLRSR